MCHLEIPLQAYISLDNILTLVIKKCLKTQPCHQTKQEKKNHSLPAVQLYLGSFPLLLTSSPPLLNHDTAPNLSSFPTILNRSHHFSLSHFGFMLCVSCSESYITYLLVLMWWCLRPLFTPALHFSFSFSQASCLEKYLFLPFPNNYSFLQ